MFLMIGETVLQMIIARQQVASTGERFTMGDLEAIFSDIDNNLPDNRLVESELLEAVPYLTRLGAEPHLRGGQGHFAAPFTPAAVSRLPLAGRGRRACLRRGPERHA